MKKLISEDDIKKLLKQGSNVLVKSKDSILTPLALDLIREKKIIIIEKEISESGNLSNSDSQLQLIKKIAIGSDHTGFKIKNILIKYLSEKGFTVQDYGTYNEQSCDYPDFAKKVAISVALNENDAGILIDATGIPSAITSNKIKSIRAATCYNEFSAKSSRAHNNANVLVLGAKALGEETIKSIADTWLSTPFEGGRHQKRLDKIDEIEKDHV